MHQFCGLSASSVKLPIYIYIYIYIHLIFLSPMHNFMHRHLKVYIYTCICMKQCIELRNIIYIIYIYIYFNVVRLRYQTVGWCLLRYYIPSIIQYDFQNIKFLYNMQCVIDISKNSQKMQWSMRIGTFLETGRLALKC